MRQVARLRVSLERGPDGDVAYGGPEDGFEGTLARLATALVEEFDEEPFSSAFDQCMSGDGRGNH